jgi:arylsulfatase
MILSRKIKLFLFIKVLGIFILIRFTSCIQSQNKMQNDDRPNILLLVADDLGYSDLGCFGGEIDTPNIDALASNGILFSRFHTAPMCSPTRAMLLTGNDNHIAGIGRQNSRTDIFGYEGHLSIRVVPVPKLLQEAGYHTYITGKWHLGIETQNNPNNNGFENSFVLLEGVGNHFNGQGIFKESSRSHYTENGEVTQWPLGSYSTDLYTDKLIAFINKNKEDKKPFFAFGAYTSPHWPLQVGEEYRKKYEGVYTGGYEKLKNKRLQGLIDKGLVPSETSLPYTNREVKPWESLSDYEKQVESRKMEIYAGMVDNLDKNIGRIIQYLKDIGEYENTLIVFMSDNGAAGEDYFNTHDVRPYISEYYMDNLKSMGAPNSLVSYGKPWAEASTAAFRDFKEYTTNGGIITPMIMAGPMINRTNEIEHGITTVMDLAPTFIELANTSYPIEQKGRKLYPMKGTSLVPFIKGEIEIIHNANYVFGLEHSGNTMLRKGFWKITNTSSPFSEDNFELYNLSSDISERFNVKKEFPEKYRELLIEWDRFSKETQLQLPR